MKRVLTSLATVSIITSGVLGIIVQHHYCQDEHKSSAFWVKPKSCHEVDPGATCPMHAAMASEHGEEHEKGCCDNQLTYLKDDTDQVFLPCPLLKDLLFWIPVTGIETIAGPDQLDLPLTEYLNYKPPLIVCDPHSELQTFLC